MEERRQYKTKDRTKYKEKHNIIRTKIREAKEQWMVQKCKEIEDLQAKHDLFNVHKKIKELGNKNRKHHTTFLRDKNNRIVIGIEDKLKQWTQYVKTLFNEDRPPTPTLEDISELGPEITTEEITRAVKLQKNRKATGPDKIHVEMLKLLAYQDGSGMKLLTALFNTMYTTGKIPYS